MRTTYCTKAELKDTLKKIIFQYNYSIKAVSFEFGNDIIEVRYSK